MNILPKKSWHVRNKDNVARVRRDEAQAREEQRERERRALLAQQEARTDLLRKRARSHATPAPGPCVAREDPGPVDLFRELVEEGKGAGGGNREYEEEKRQEQERREKALGVLTYLGQSAAEAQTQPPWYQLPPEPRGTQCSPAPDEKVKSHLDPLRDLERQLGKKRKKQEGSGHSKAPEKLQPQGPRKSSLEQLRAERLKREAAEQARTQALMAALRGEQPQEEEEPDDRKRRYNSQFHPQLARPPRR
ncbi:leukocyte receptor cluster member 1 isoform X1 [Monodelphis domestica]|uniref:leukocyte receptor cluster member 1 isoform X1 n=1 Tax=Monodelphis domestica TaxID=13616 RepID=UPI0024E24A83|nr:leukocyte receptor cluster member 1 isoform X1 [Monodelphis domestica]